MAARISVSRAKQCLSNFHESIMECVDLYFVESTTKFLSGMRGRSQAGSLATNPRTQLAQSQWKDSKTGLMQVLPTGHTWGTSGSIARYDSIFTEPANVVVGLRMAVDVLLTRAMPPVIVYVACRALATLPKTLLASESKKRLGKAAPAFVKWINATNELAGVILEEGEKKKTRKRATRISWSEASTPRKAKSKTPTSAYACASLCEKLIPGSTDGLSNNAKKMLHNALMARHSYKELEAGGKALVEAELVYIKRDAEAASSMFADVEMTSEDIAALDN